MKQVFKNIIVAILTYEARVLLRRARPTIIAITGSVGKTTTKDAIFSTLKNHFKTRKSQKSFNSEIGVPLSILGLPNAWNNPFLWFKNIIDGFFIAFFSRNYPEMLVLETGVDRPGDMSKLTAWLKPDVVVITRLPDVPVHVEFFGTPEAVVAEKLTLLEALTPTGIFIYNADDIKLQEVAKDVRQPAIGFSRYATAQFMASADKIVYNDDLPVGSSLVLTHLSESATIKINGSFGMQNAYTYTAAAAVASHFGISLSQIVSSLSEHAVPAGRMRILPGIKHTLIIDDSYNSSPTAVESALLSLKELSGATRKIAVLGDMLELGQYSSREHERVGELTAKCADVLFTIGIRARKIAEGALEHGMNEKVIFQYEDAVKAGRELQAYLNLGDVILVKASQGIRAEKIVEEIMAEPDRAAELLVRQDSSWRSR